MKSIIFLFCTLFYFQSLSQVNSDAVASFEQNFQKKHARSINEILSEANYQQEIIDKISQPAEGTMTWERYRNIFIKEERIKAGLQFYEEHQEALKAVSETTGVSIEVILGIIGVETNYGGNKGSYKVLDALYTLGFGYPRRAKFFQSELEKFLILCESEGLDPLQVKGSYAGAMGYSQFMPSSYIAYAKSYEQGGSADLMNSPEDAIASVANYIKVHRWKTGQPVATKANFTRKVTHLNKQVLKPKNQLSDYTKLGILPAESIQGDPKATLVSLKSNEKEETWFGFYNFYVITRYNRSPFYAMAVHQLGQAIKGQMNKPE